MGTRLFSTSILGLGITLSVGACADPPFTATCNISPDASFEQRSNELQRCLSSSNYDVIDSRLRREFDILFLIDNSASMSPKQRVLAQNIPLFIQKIEESGANYHVGIITSDVGTLPASGQTTSGTVSDPRCNTIKGDDGMLQNKPCTSRSGTGTEFSQACQTLCPDARFVPQNGERFIAKTNGVINVPSLKDAMGQEIGPQRAFQCMALVGDGGCGVESPLESMKRALDGHLSENSGFLRQDSVLAVIFITDEDDCSVRESRRAENGEGTMSCDPNIADPPAECFTRDYRCLARSITCNESLSVPGAKSNCVEKPNNYLEPLSTYVNFLTRMRSPEKLVIGGIWSPSMLDYQAGKISDGRLVVAPETGAGTATNQLNRGQKENAACHNPDPLLTTDPRGFFGQAQLRLSSFARKFEGDIAIERSICAAADYPAALDAIAQDLVKREPYCLSNRPVVQNGTPICLVGYVDESEPTALPDTYLPECSATCCDAWASSKVPLTKSGRDPAIVSACTSEAADCFCAEPSRAGICDSVAVGGIWRKGDAEPPAGKIASFRCASDRTVQ